MSRLLSALFSALFPGALVASLALASLAVSGGDALILDLTQTYGRVVYGAGLALAWVFHRSRVFIVLACLGAMDVLGLASGERMGLLSGWVTGLAVVVGGLALTRDRGVRSRGGFGQLFGTAVVGAATWKLLEDPDRARELGEAAALPVASLELFGAPWGLIAAGTVALAGVLYGFYRWRGPVDRAFFWALVLLVAAAHPDVGESRSALLLVAAGLTLTLSVVETSYMLAYRDDLTGLPGRRALMQYLDGIGGLYTIAMVDVDHFKRFNDKHGHDVGDQVLKMVASRLARAPGGAKAYRYGGEEFTLVLPGRTREQAAPHLESVRESIENARFALRSWRRPRKKPQEATKKAVDKKARSLSVTVSIGMADTAGDDDSAEVVLKRADQALYRAKKKGRNRLSR